MGKKQFKESVSLWRSNGTIFLISIAAFLIITLVYFSPLLEGKKLKQHDITMFKGMSKEIVDHREATGEEPLWTNSMFGGMPAWQISVQYPGNLTTYIDKAVTLWLPYPANYVFLYFLGFFILMLVLKIDPWVSLIGAIAFALSSYFFIILGAGHTSKAHAIGYMAPVLAGIILAFRGKYWQGALLTAIALALEIKSAHLQITYYLLIIVIVYGIFKLIEAITKKQYAHFFKATGILIIAALLAISTYTTNLWATYDYGQDTMRGKPELTKDAENKSSGLDKDYITAWSYGIGETWSLIIPNVKGGVSGVLGNADAIIEADPAYRNAIAQQSNAYWGDQPGTSGPVYVGVIVMFLFILGMFIVSGRLKWVLLTVTLLSILLAWGRNWMPFTDFFIDYIPGYNKFRAVSMILVIAELAIPVLAFMALGKIVTDAAVLKTKKNSLYYAFGLTGGFILIFYLAPSVFFDFLSTDEHMQFAELLQGKDAAQVNIYLTSLENVRIAIFKADALRSLIFVILAALLVFFYAAGKFKSGYLIAGLGLLILIDMVSVNRRYLNNDNFIRAKQFDVPFNASTANKYILNDNNPDFRVLDITKSTFNDASCSYFHKSIGGYHGAKLQRYQDLIDGYLQGEIQSIFGVLSPGVTSEKINNMFKEQQVLNMLNMKYVIYNPEAMPLLNSSAFGHAWFANNVVMVKGADEEFGALGKYELQTTAVVDYKFASQLEGKRLVHDSTSFIELVSYAPNNLIYNYNASAEQLVVFSEIYYDKGWNAYIDGQEVPYLRANYVLRALVVPAGEHEIEFKFEPRIWIVGERISFAGSLLLILLLIAGIGFEIRKTLVNKEANNN
ncbi:MAG: YfhO family protein [Bacteroidetes bacterium]|nr:YfhO family protein [Bacteroidota bacterium]MBL6944424.1 YfhO family protein [Bacteroidales bacterium]